MKKLYKVEMQYSYGWDDAGWTENDKPMRFKTKAAANKEIEEFVENTNDAVARGDMECGHEISEFRVVPA